MTTTIRIWATDETDPSRRGQSLGVRWRDQVHSTLAEYDELFTARGVAAAAVRELSEDSRVLVREHAPEVLAEIDGVAAGAGIEPWQAMSLNARTEILARAGVVTQECSTAVFLPVAGSPRGMQTWDWYSQMAHETLVRSQPGAAGSRLVTFGELGQVAKIGVSSRGVGVHFNILQHSSDGSRAGVPVHVLTRMILDRADTLEEALAIVDSVPLGASTVLTVLTREPAAACVELSPAGWAAIRATPGEPLLHTNHFLDPALAAGEREATTFSSTRHRLSYLRDRATAVEIPEPLARLAALASDAPNSICVDPDPRRAPDDRPQTKATFTIDVDRAELGFAPSHPRDITAETWRAMAA